MPTPTKFSDATPDELRAVALGILDALDGEPYASPHTHGAVLLATALATLAGPIPVPRPKVYRSKPVSVPPAPETVAAAVDAHERGEDILDGFGADPFLDSDNESATSVDLDALAAGLGITSREKPAS